MKFDKKMLTLYAITDSGTIGGRDLENVVEQAILGGATCIQLREKELGSGELAEKTRSLVRVCRSYNVPLIIDDDYKAALAGGADGVHVGLGDAPAEEIRKAAGPDFIIGVTAKTVQQAKAAEADGADYIGVGAVFPSPTKKNAVRITPELLREICGSVSIPAVAIGGIAPGNVHEINGCGHCGIAVVSAIFAPEDVKSAAEELRKAAELSIKAVRK